VPNTETIACRAATLWPSTGEGDAERTLEESAVEIYDLEPLLELPGQLHLQFADETLVP